MSTRHGPSVVPCTLIWFRATQPEVPTPAAPKDLSIERMAEVFGDAQYRAAAGRPLTEVTKAQQKFVSQMLDIVLQQAQH